MPQPRHLNSAPIVEGIIDIQVKASGPAPLDVFRRLASEFAVAAKIEEVRSLAVQFLQAAGTAPNQKVHASGPLGIRCFSPDGKVIVQMRKNGFTYSRLTPYTSWEEILPQADRIFRAYLQALAPEQTTRIAGRNINRLLFPAGKLFESPQLFFTNPPIFPTSKGARRSHWMTRFRLKKDEATTEAIITCLTEDNLVGDKQPVILDVDVFQSGGLPTDADALVPMLGPLRTWKNELFFNALTEDTLVNYQ